MADFDIARALDVIFQKPLERLSEIGLNFYPSFACSNTSQKHEGSDCIPSTLDDSVIGFAPASLPIFPDGKSVEEFVTPDISFIEKISKSQTFSLYCDFHKQIAGRLIQIFLDAPNEIIFARIASDVRDKANPCLFYYALSVAVPHRSNTQKYKIPAVIEQFPINFIEPSILNEARAEAYIHGNTGNSIPVDIPRNFTASKREKEQRLAYFREDIGINAHYWHWHIIYPCDGPIEIVNKDRRGELFYYIHQQIMARYDAERFCNSLAKTKPFSVFTEALPTDYFPKILNCLNNRTYPARPQGVVLKNLQRLNNSFDVSNLQRWTDRIHLAIDQKLAIDESGKYINLDEKTGIDILGNMIESSALSVNRQLYGNLHGAGHNVISCSHDPDERYLEDVGVMGDISTAMRDPIFYSWHAFIDSLFQKFKATLPPYKTHELNFDGIQIENVEIQLENSTDTDILKTFYQKSDINLAAGLDYAQVDNLYGRYVHLQHKPFLYKILINNESQAMRMGTCRIFLGPKTDERQIPLDFNEQRLLMIELDKFKVTLYPGQNGVVRRSEDSSITIPFYSSIKNLSQESQIYGCGWPMYMLIPRGNEIGMPFDIFIMVSDYTDDIVDQKNNDSETCGGSSSYCGLKDKLYPDRRSMGYPFDRPSEINTLEKFAQEYPNMIIKEVLIQHKDEIVNEKDYS